jgi:hypothetical protein
MKQALYAWIEESNDPWPNIDIPDDLPLGKTGPWAALAQQHV